MGLRFTYIHNPLDPDWQIHAFKYVRRPNEVHPSVSGACMPAYEWCLEQFGDEPEFNSRGRWTMAGSFFYFRDDDDAFHFRMRWC